jgi:hypothetical protein
MLERATWDNWSEASSLVHMAYGLAILADYGCADSIVSREEREVAQSAILGGAHLALRRAAALMDVIEPRESGA